MATTVDALAAGAVVAVVTPDISRSLGVAGYGAVFAGRAVRGGARLGREVRVVECGVDEVEVIVVVLQPRNLNIHRVATGESLRPNVLAVGAVDRSRLT